MLRFTNIIVLVLMSFPLLAARIELVKDNQPRAVIVIPEKPHSKIALAAKDLQRYIQKISGVELKIVRSNKELSGNGIYIWNQDLVAPADRLTRKDDPDAYVIKVRDGKVIIYGRTGTASSFGAYSFIQDKLGVRWFAPGDDWEYVPRGKAGELTVEVDNKKYAPSISPRLWAGHYYTPMTNQWCIRQRVRGNEIRRKGSFANNIYRIFPPQKYGKTNPEYYPLVNGKRYIPKPGEVKWRPCEGSEEVQKVVVDYIRNYFDKNPDADSFSLGLDDVFHICSCERCNALDHQADDIPKRRFSSRHYKFVNIIAREVAKTHPDRFIGTLIYAPTLQPPVDVPKMEPNTFGFITQNSAAWKNPEIRKRDMQLTAEWARRIPYLSRYEYIGLSCITPRYYPHLLDEAFRYDLKHNFQGMYQEVCTFLPLTAPMVWALSEMQWDAGKSMDSLLDEYMQKVYLDAASEMKAFYDHLEACWANSTGYAWIYNDLVKQAQVMKVEELKKAYAMLDAAYQKSQIPLVKKRIKWTEDSLRYGGLVIEEFALAKKAEAVKLAAPEDALKVMDMAVDFAKLAAEREKFWADSMKAPSIFGETLRAQSKRGNLVSNGQISTLEGFMVEPAINALNLLAKQAPEKFEQQLKRLQQAPESAFTQTVIAATLPADLKSANLLPNASFERAKPNGEPLHWAAWGAVPDKFPLDKKGGRNGSSAARVNYNVGVAYLHYRQVKPGEMFYSEVWIKGEGQGFGTLGFRFKTKDGKWHPNRELEPRINSEYDGNWRRIRLFCKVPEGAAVLQFSVGGYRIADGAYVLLDDAVLQKIYSEKELAARKKFQDAKPTVSKSVPEPAGADLLRNPGFEITLNDNQKARNWYNSGAPFGGKFKVVPAEGRNQSNAAMVYSTHGSFIQFLRVKPGEKYYVSGWVRSSNQAKLYLMVRYKYRNGRWMELKDKEYKVSVPATYQWQQIQGEVTVPEGAAQMHLMIGANNIKDGEFILIDDAVVKKISGQ